MGTYKETEETYQEILVAESDYGTEEQLHDHIERFLTVEEIGYLCSKLRVSELREMAAEVIIAGIEHIRGNSSQLEYATLINSWLATAEETVVAGSNLKRIAARRKGISPDPDQEVS